MSPARSPSSRPWDQRRSFKNNAASLDLVTTGSVAAGHSIFLQFAMKPSGGPITAYAHASGNSTHIFDFTLDGEAINTAAGGGAGGAVRTVIFSTQAVPALAAGTVFTVNFPTSDAQAVTAAKFRGITAVNALDRVVTNAESTSTVSSGFTATTTQAQEVLIGAIGVRGQVDEAAPNDSTNNLGFTAGTAYTVWAGNGTPSGNAGNKNSSIHPEFRVVNAIGSYQADGLLNSNAGGPWAAILATYKADLTDHFEISAPASAGAGIPFTITVRAKEAFTGGWPASGSETAPRVRSG